MRPAPQELPIDVTTPAHRREMLERPRWSGSQSRVDLGLRTSPSQQEDRAEARARPPELKAEACGSQHQAAGSGDGSVQGEPAAEGDLQLVQVREPDRKHRRDEGVRAQGGVAGIVIVIVRRTVMTASPHGGTDQILKLNLTPHGPLRLLACAPPSLVATAPPSLSGARRTTSQLGSGRLGASRRAARHGQGGAG